MVALIKVLLAHIHIDASVVFGEKLDSKHCCPPTLQSAEKRRRLSPVGDLHYVVEALCSQEGPH